MMKIACHATEPDPYTLPAARPGLEEAAAAVAADWAQAAAFALERARGEDDPRPVLFVATADWMRERGRLSPRGLLRLGIEPQRLILVRARQGHRGAVGAGGGAEVGRGGGRAWARSKAAAFVATRRLDFAARAGRAVAVLLRAEAPGDLSVARLRWQVSAEASAAHPYDPAAPGRDAADRGADAPARRAAGGLDHGAGR